MERIHLYVPPEEYAQVKASGAFWDDESKRWYIGRDMVSADFSRWLGEDGEAPEFGYSSDQAFVAAAQVSCVACHEPTEVICIYCESGTDLEREEPMAQCTLSNVWSVDDALAAQLARWPQFRQESGTGSEEGCFVNYCSQCGAKHEDYLLHGEPGDVFFCVALAEAVELTPLSGRVQMSGDCGFGI